MDIIYLYFLIFHFHVHIGSVIYIARNLKELHVVRKNGNSYLDIIYRFHEPRSCHKKRWIGHTPRCGNDLTRSPMQWLGCNFCINNLELYISDGLITERSFSSTPLKSAQNKIELWLVRNELDPQDEEGEKRQFVYPWTMESLTAFSKPLSTSVESVSSNKMLGPWTFGIYDMHTRLEVKTDFY